MVGVDCGVTLDNRFGISEYREDVEERIWNKAALLELVQILSGDGISFEEARTSILSVATPGVHQSAVQWLAACEAWSHDVENARATMRGSSGGRLRVSQTGSLAFATAIAQPRLRIVSSAGDTHVTLFDFHEEIVFQADRVASAESISAKYSKT